MEKLDSWLGKNLVMITYQLVVVKRFGMPYISFKMPDNCISVGIFREMNIEIRIIPEWLEVISATPEFFLVFQVVVDIGHEGSRIAMHAFS